MSLGDLPSLSLPDFVLVKAGRVGVNQRSSNIIHIAHELGTDVEQFEKYLISAETTAHGARPHPRGQGHEHIADPTLFINCRRHVVPFDAQSLLKLLTTRTDTPALEQRMPLHHDNVRLPAGSAPPLRPRGSRRMMSSHRISGEDHSLICCLAEANSISRQALDMRKRHVN